ncbi:MAG: hypothetical protein KQJ78_02360 [Deltaproteobacteria bacterium]|nr:hypothetical protein [Deltaproteobacteria bacterium]
MAPKSKRVLVRVERVDTKCGAIGHMSVEEIRARTVGEEVDLTCPQCGEIHLTPEDAAAAELRKFTETDRFREIQRQAEEE